LIQSALGNRRRAIENDHNRIGWTTTNPDPVKYRPLGIDGGIARSLQNMTKLSDLLASRSIPLTIVVYPWAQQIAQNDRDGRQVALWRDFCPGHCKAFVNLFPVFFAAADSDKDWYEHLYILGDDHFSAAGNRMMFEELLKRLMPQACSVRHDLGDAEQHDAGQKEQIHIGFHLGIAAQRADVADSLLARGR
jgi:hypothetical protein